MVSETILVNPSYGAFLFAKSLTYYFNDNFIGNPISCHPKHREMTARYLHKNTTSVKVKITWGIANSQCIQFNQMTYF